MTSRAIRPRHHRQNCCAAALSTRLPLQTDILGEHGRRVDAAVDRRHIDAEAEQVVLQQLAYQVRDTPAVQNGMMEREDQIHTVITDKRAQAV